MKLPPEGLSRPRELREAQTRQLQPELQAKRTLPQSGRVPRVPQDPSPMPPGVSALPSAKRSPGLQARRAVITQASDKSSGPRMQRSGPLQAPSGCGDTLPGPPNSPRRILHAQT